MISLVVFLIIGKIGKSHDDVFIIFDIFLLFYADKNTRNSSFFYKRQLLISMKMTEFQKTIHWNFALESFCR